jgi:acyl carrier protein
METDSTSNLVSELLNAIVIHAFEESSTVRPIALSTEIETLGLDSLETVSVIQEIEKKTGFGIPDDEAAQFVTVQNVIAYLETHTR